MKIKPLLLLVLMLVGLLMYISCRKIDQQAEQSTVNTSDTKFFTVHRSSDPLETALVNFIKKKNEETPFVDKVIKQIGSPYWDKGMIVKKRRLSHGRSASDSSFVVYIPFVRDSENYVNSAMAISVAPGDTSFNYLCDWQYSSQTFSTNTITDTTSEKFALLFMVLDKNTLGHQNFKIQDKRLFNGNSNYSDTANIERKIKIEQTQTSGRASLLASICYYTTVWTITANWHCTHTGQCASGVCDQCYLCVDYSVSQHGEVHCFDEEVGGPPSGGGGSGGGGGGSTPPECPSGFARTENVTDPCGPGWIPIEDDPPTFPANPCKVVDSLMTTNNFPLYYHNLRNGVTNNFESGFMFQNPFEANTTYESVDGVPGTLGVDMNPAVPIDGAVHNHYNDSLRLPIFTFDDFYKMYEWFKNGKIKDLKTFTFGMVSDSSAYIMMITDSTAFANFGNTFLNNKESVEDFMYAFYDGYEIHEAKSVTENEKSFLKALQGLGTGISLFRANNNITQFTKIRINENNQVRPSLCN